VALAAASAIAAVVVQRMVRVGRAPAQTHGSAGTARVALPRSAWPPMLASAFIAATGLGVFVVSGAWLDDAYGLSTGGLGLVAAGFGIVELCSSMSVVSFGDRIGARRSVLIGLAVLGAGIAIMATAGSSRSSAIRPPKTSSIKRQKMVWTGRSVASSRTRLGPPAR